MQPKEALAKPECPHPKSHVINQASTDGRTVYSKCLLCGKFSASPAPLEVKTR